MSRFPDRARSHAVLLGAGRFRDPGLTGLPAVHENLLALRSRLTDPGTGVFAAGNCVTVPDDASVAEAGRLLNRHAEQARDLLLVYYAGHGLIDDRGRLHLALHHTETSSLKYSALAVDLLREDVGASPAEARVLILDCCFAGRAIDVMAADASLIGAQLEAAGTYTLASTTANAPAYAPHGQRFTAFTGALLDALGNDTPLTMDEIYLRVDRELAARSLPRPQRRATNTAGSLCLSRGPGEPAPQGESSPRQVTFRRAPAELRRRQRQVAVRMAAGTSALTAAMGGLFAVLNHDPDWLWAILVFGGSSALFVLLITLLMTTITPKQAELVIDSTGITVATERQRSTVRWADVSDVGLLPSRGVNPALKKVYAANHLLVVRYRPEVPVPGTPGLSRQLHDLGYVTLGPIGAFDADQENLLAALGRFGGPRLFRTERELLSRDPRLRPDLI
ncbi:caspase, EACC1-associated type [Amycolatopsis kentuckyensis]|uniref:caspase, EACC1-associated type n=1 Tax=Amycolatopsis kentuckyensis TaxID=218823 RepID=UPI00356278E9